MNCSLEELAQWEINVSERLELRQLLQCQVDLGASTVILNVANFIELLLCQDFLGVTDQLFEGYLVGAVAHNVFGL